MSVPGVCGIDPSSPGFATGVAELTGSRQPVIAVVCPPRSLGEVG